MTNGNKDLDRSLEDTIKLNSNKGRGGKRALGSSGPIRTIDRGNHERQTNSKRGNTRITGGRNTPRSHVNNRIGSKPINQRVDGNGSLINSRLGRGISKPQRGSGIPTGMRNGSLIINRSSSSENRQTSERLDPSKIIITKPMVNRTASTKKTERGSESLIIQSKLTKPHVSSKPDNRPKSKQQNPHSSTSSNHSQESPKIRDEREYSKQQPQLRQKEPAKKIVVICNLDPRATAEDVGEACSMFGPILSCDMLLDAMGRPLNEAEIEFVHPDAALECQSRLDNSLADGRLLRAKLQQTPTLSVKPRYSSRSVVASARLQPEMLQNTSAMIQQQQPQYLPPTYPSVYSPQTYYPQQHPFSQNHYRRY